jgi:hypothetical protein
MPFLPKDFEVPAVVESERFRMRSITIHDAFKDYDAVMSAASTCGAASAKSGAGPRPTSRWNRTSSTSAGTRRSSSCGPRSITR